MIENSGLLLAISALGGTNASTRGADIALKANKLATESFNMVQ